MRKSLLAGVAVILVLLGILVTLVLPRPCRVTLENCERIKDGLTLAQVEEILGGPEGDYRNGPTFYAHHSDFGPAPTYLCWRHWEGDEGNVDVAFDETDTVLWAEFRETQPVGGPLELLAWRLNRRWERLWGR